MKSKLYVLIPVIQVLYILFTSYFFITETNDSRSYYGIASQLPKISESLFPIFYPFLLRIASFICGSYFVTSKIINVICILSFFLITKKYIEEWKILWLFSLSWFFFSILSNSWSEAVLIPLMTAIFVLQRKFWNTKGENNIYIIYHTLLLFLLFITKYSMVYMIIGTFLFGALMYIYTKQRKFLFFIYSAFFSIILALLYLYANYQLTGYFTGNRAALGDLNINLRLSLFNTLQAVNPFFGNIYGRTPFFVVIIIFIILSVIYINRIFTIWREKKTENLYFIFVGLFYLFFLWASYFYTKIDILNIRLLFPFCFLFFLGLIANNLETKKIKFYKYLIIFMYTLQILISLNNILSHNNYYLSH
ncbi:hypothetical protein [Chryseobacterium sp. RLHN22]|uniref:hypothetical protein n=1 Tax=Chryseobacterium sp. RLHN22 TaxID=3437885 RepID=UPI003D9BCD57